MKQRRKQLSINPITLDVTKLSHEGRGIAHYNDKIVFVFGALPNEKIIAQYTQNHRRFAEAKVVATLQKSPQRVNARCTHFGVCGGCQLQHLEPIAQIQLKQDFLKEQLLQHKLIPQQWALPLIGNFFGYRQKARLGVRYVTKKSSLLVGFREQKSNKIALIDSCHILHPKVGMKMASLREVISSLKARNEIAQIEVAMGKEEVALVFRHLAPLEKEDIEKLQAFCMMHHFAFYLQPGGIDSVHKVWPRQTPFELTYALLDQNLIFHFHPCDFIQVNSDMNQAMINQALSWVQPTENDTILDLFCGLGNFSLPFAQKAAKVVGVEGAARMVAKAKENAKYNQLDNVEFYCADLETDNFEASWARSSYSTLILDPPRCGASKIIENINRFKMRQILYISCNSATFARDAATLVHQHGFVLEKVGVMDMFSQTAHVEVMGFFIR